MENKIHDPVFEELKLDEKYGDWVGEVEIQPNLRISFNLAVLREEILENIEQFRERFQHAVRNEPQAREYAARDLLEVHNENWRDVDTDPVTKEEFCSRIKPTSIVIEEDFSANYYYDDDNLFLRHVIIVWMDEDGNFGDAQIAG